MSMHITVVDTHDSAGVIPLNWFHKINVRFRFQQKFYYQYRIRQQQQIYFLLPDQLAQGIYSNTVSYVCLIIVCNYSLHCFPYLGVCPVASVSWEGDSLISVSKVSQLRFFFLIQGVFLFPDCEANSDCQCDERLHK